MELLIPDISDRTLARLEQRAASSGRSLDEEIKAIIVECLNEMELREQAGQFNMEEAAAEADRIRSRLAATGKVFGDSADEIRKGRT